MAITNFDFPGTTLRQVFEESTTGTVSTLGVACVGMQYKVHEEAGVPVVLEVPQDAAAYDPEEGLGPVALDTTINFDTTDLIPRLSIEDGVWAYVNATASNLAPAIQEAGVRLIRFSAPVKAGAGKIASPLFGGRGAKVGDTVIISDGTDVVVTTISAINNISGSGYIEIQVADLGTFDHEDSITVKFCVVQDATFAANANVFSISGANITVVSGVSTKLNDLAGMPGLLQAGVMTVDLLEIDTTYIGKLGSVSSVSEVETLLGTPSVDNPLALAVYFAAAAARNTTVFFTAVDEDTEAKYLQAVGFLERYPEIYSIVPATEDASIIREISAACINASEDEESKIRRSLWYGITSEVTGPTAADVIADVISLREARVSSYRAQAVWADGILFRGKIVPNFAGAAAAAGMRSYEAPHRPLSNLGYTFFSVAETSGLTRAQLKQIGAEGIWIIGNDNNGSPINMKQVTSAMANNINLDEESIIASTDEIALGVSRVGENRVGNSNISPAMLSALQLDLRMHMDSRLRNTSGSVYIGPQLLSWELLSMYQDEVNRDWVYADFECEPPKPFNKFKMTMRVI